jgi:hypothetical protein
VLHAARGIYVCPKGTSNLSFKHPNASGRRTLRMVLGRKVKREYHAIVRELLGLAKENCWRNVKSGNRSGGNGCTAHGCDHAFMDDPLTLSADVRAALPAPVQVYLAEQETQVALLRDQVTALEGELAQLRLQLAETPARAHQNSGNSSRPPSSDPPGPRPHLKRKPSGRKRGGQKGPPRPQPHPARR